jgi:hypothetical protein
MIDPAKNRLHPYEAGWLTLLVQMKVATEAEARAAWGRMAQQGIDKLEARREQRRTERERKRRKRDQQ